MRNQNLWINLPENCPPDLKKIILISTLLGIIAGQIEPPDGLRTNPPGVWALRGGTVYQEPETILESATIIIRDGLIENAGRDIKIPVDATILDMSGKTIYPGFIESWVPVPIDKTRENSDHDAHWNFKVHARREISKVYQPDKKTLKSLHKLGFTSAHIVPDSGIFQGQTALIQLDNNSTILQPEVCQDIAYEVDGWDSNKYPNALLGVVALIRQTFIDAKWFREAEIKAADFPQTNKPIKQNRDLKILSQWMSESQPFIFETSHELSVLRSFNISEEFSINSWLKGSGYEYRRIDEIATHKPFIILPLDFPLTPDVTDPYQALSYSNSELKHWDMAADNPAVLFENGISVAITSHELKAKEFRKNLARSVQRSLSESDALAALTTIPAAKMGMEKQLGKIKKGFLANLTIIEGNYFEEKSEVISVWVGGKEYPVKPKYELPVAGEWELSIGEKLYQLEIHKKYSHYSGKIIRDSTEFQLAKLNIAGRQISWQITWDTTAAASRFTGHILADKMEGTAHDLQQPWTAEKRADIEDEYKIKKAEERSQLSVFYPEGAYGWDTPFIEGQEVLIQNAIIWTCGAKGILDGYDILFSSGKVKKIGRGLKIPKCALIIDGAGKHITPGLIDCHSHSAAFSINEGTQSITAEVRIQDVLNSDDIAIYRELAGGLTIANILHGSANPIGGQNAVIKLRWGAIPDGLLYSNAVKGIKFALGENVKQSNWGDDHTTRYPQTRMGVEQIMRDAFSSAREYQQEWNDYRKNPKQWKKKVPPRQDLELDALVEILEGERQIHCHSYRQSKFAHKQPEWTEGDHSR